MDVFLTTFKAVIEGLGATVVLPIVIFVLAWVLGAKPGRAFRAGVMVGIAFIGINLVINLMWATLSDVAQAMVTNLGIQRDVVDVGWPSAAAIAFGSKVGLWVIPMALLLNFVLLLVRLTKTLNVDVWNFWHFAFIGSLVTAATGSLANGLFAAAIAAVLALFLADWTAKGVQRFYNIPGISIPHLTTAPGVPIAIAVNWVIDRIPGLRDLDADPETIQDRFGVVGEPVVQGLVIGLVLGILGYYNAGDSQTIVIQVLQTGINLAAVMVLLPRMVQLLMEGMIPVSEAARDFMQRRASGRDIYVGLDSAILIGHPAAISSSLILVPIAILLSVILPGNRVILFADLAVIPFVVAMFAPIMRGNILRMIMAGTITLGIGFYIATGMASFFTTVAVESGFDIPQDAALITSIADGFLWPPFVFLTAAQIAGLIGLIVLVLLLAVAMYLYLRNPVPWEIAAGGPSPSDEEEAVEAQLTAT